MTSAPPGRTPSEFPHRDDDGMGVTFEIEPRYGSDPVPAVDAQRVGQSRRIAAAWLKYRGLAAMTDSAVLIVSELVTNAVLHSGTKEVSLTLSVKDSRLRITVADGMPSETSLRGAAEDGESGRGLFLVDALVAANRGIWGIGDAGLETWCVLPLPEERPVPQPVGG